MEVIIAKYSGFCFGVKRAIELVLRVLEKRKGELYSVGPLIHNPQVTRRLASKGLKVIKDLKGIGGGTMVVCSHGVHPSLIKEARRRKMKLVDATCPFVSAAQDISRTLEKEGYEVIIVGDRHHPEVKALVGSAADKAIVISDVSRMDRLRLKSKRIGVIAQTTQSECNYLRIVSELIKKEFSEARVFNTICRATVNRQRSAIEVARGVDIMLVLGGKRSANTRRLAEICEQTGVATYHLEGAEQLEPGWFKGKNKVGIASGTSTPDWVIGEVMDTVKELKVPKD